MKILHTADVHLKQDNPATIDALETVLAEATAQKVDLLTIGGDLFDAPADAEALRPDLRTLFKNNPFDILAIPGNHDETVFKKNLRFGADLDILADTPYAKQRFGTVEIIGVPFTSSMTEQLYGALRAVGDPSKTQVLLLHCTLDIGFHTDDVGEGEGAYFPVTQATLGEFDFEYILAGHIHSRDRAVPLRNGGKFIYPGSPVSHATSETGKRNAVLVDTDADRITSVELDTFYYDTYAETIRPGEEQAVLDEIASWVSARIEDNCELSITVDGFVDRDEGEFWDELAAAADPIDPVDHTRTVSHVLHHPLYQRFIEKLEADEAVEDPEHTDTLLIRVLADLLSQRKVQPS